MLDWLMSIQMPCGGFQGGVIGSAPVVPVTFNTGQILLGLAAGAAELGEKYLLPMRRAADWLVETQDRDGCWRKAPTPFAAPGEKTYETHVAWGLLEAARFESNRRYADVALANIRWALRYQKDNGWFAKCCLSDPAQPLTHTIGYTLRGIIEGHRYSKDPQLLMAACKTGRGLLHALENDGFLPGRLKENWTGAVSWACLTGSAQIAHCWLMLFEHTGETEFRDAARTINGYVRRTMKVAGSPDARGGMKGSFPVNGNYCPYEYLNWACKFTIDTNIAELAALESMQQP
jgi:hypothetical protein